jgi:hypothetical protein
LNQPPAQPVPGVDQTLFANRFQAQVQTIHPARVPPRRSHGRPPTPRLLPRRLPSPGGGVPGEDERLGPTAITGLVGQALPTRRRPQPNHRRGGG